MSCDCLECRSWRVSAVLVPLQVKLRVRACAGIDLSSRFKARSHSIANLSRRAWSTQLDPVVETELMETALVGGAGSVKPLRVSARQSNGEHGLVGFGTRFCRSAMCFGNLAHDIKSQAEAGLVVP